MPTITHPQLIDALRKAYSAERAASYAYIGHAGSLRDPEAKAVIRRIEQDEWDHRRNVLAIMRQYQISVSRFYEWKYAVIGRVIGLSCYLIGRFMPYFFAGKLESGNVCEYIVMMRYFNALGITEHDAVLYEMGIKEKEHEVYFQQVIEDEPWLPLFERIFNWGAETSLNDVDLDKLLPVEHGTRYCKDYHAKGRAVSPRQPFAEVRGIAIHNMDQRHGNVAERSPRRGDPTLRSNNELKNLDRKEDAIV